MKTHFFHAIIAGTLATIVNLIHNSCYSNAYLADFSSVVNTGSIIGASFFGCILASVAFYFSRKLLKLKGEIIFSILFFILSFASFFGPYYVTLPETIDVDNQLLFAGLVLPMHLFPALAWFVTKVFFTKSYAKEALEIGF
jgi:hypothetical protein